MSNELPPDVIGQISRYLSQQSSDAVVSTMSPEAVSQGAKVVDYLNRLYGADPGAIQALMCHYIPANSSLVDDPECVVINPPVLPDGCFQVGMLGLLNGLLHALGLPYVNIDFDGVPGVGGSQKIVGFRLGAEPEC